LDVNLLRAIRLSRKRIIPAVDRQAGLSPQKEKLMRYLRVLTPLAQVPISIDHKYRWYLDGTIDANSKTGAAFKELATAGIDADTIWYKELACVNIFKRVNRIALRLPRLFILLLIRFRTIKNLDLVALQVLVGYIGYRSFFKKYQNLKAIIISDISPYLHMQWIAALAEGNKVMWWQDDYHHYNGFSDDNYLPYQCHYAAVLNEFGLKTVKENNIYAQTARRSYTVVKTLREIGDESKVGIATNVLFQASPAQIETMQKVKEFLNVSDLYLRLHPNSQLHNSRDLPKWLKVASKSETLTEFAKKVDVAIVGNTSAQLKLLCLGVPVVHLNIFDHFGYDLYQYCRLGFSFGVREIDSLSMESVKLFYTKYFEQISLEEFVNVQSEIAELQNINTK
jgi:hypothetical protein